MVSVAFDARSAAPVSVSVAPDVAESSRPPTESVPLVLKRFAALTVVPLIWSSASVVGVVSVAAAPLMPTRSPLDVSVPPDVVSNGPPSVSFVVAPPVDVRRARPCTVVVDPVKLISTDDAVSVSALPDEE